MEYGVCGPAPYSTDRGAILFLYGPVPAEEDISETAENRYKNLRHQPSCPLLWSGEFPFVQMPDGPQVRQDGQEQEGRGLEKRILGNFSEKHGVSEYR